MSLEEHWDEEEGYEPVVGSQVLRPYQHDATNAVMSSLDLWLETFEQGGIWQFSGLSRVMYTAPTQTGKTTVFAEIIKRILARDPRHRILVMAGVSEIITQGYERIRDDCGLGGWEIGMELDKSKANVINRVIVGSWQTCKSVKRPDPNWQPTVIIVDECHGSAASSYLKIFHRYGVFAGTCALIGCTATEERGDRKSLFAKTPDGERAMMERKGKPNSPAKDDECIFQQWVFEYSLFDAIDDGWAVDPKVLLEKTETDLSDVKTSRMGDFDQAELEEKVDNDSRTLKAISARREAANDRPTIAFCAGVKHARHTAELWRKACRHCVCKQEEHVEGGCSTEGCECPGFSGYRAESVDGETDKLKVRPKIWQDFDSGEVEIITNFGVIQEGNSRPTCSCIVHMRPTKSQRLYRQMSGRGTGALPWAVAPYAEGTPEERKAAIAASPKPDLIIIDLVDIHKNAKGLVSSGVILGLSVNLDMQGQSMFKVKRMLDEFEQVKHRVIGECPTTYEYLKVRLEQVSAMVRSGARSVETWKATDDGYRFVKTPPKYQADLVPDGDAFRLKVKWGEEVLLDRSGKAGHDFKAYLDKAQERIETVVSEHQASIPKGTLAKLSDKQINVLVRNGHKRDQIDQFTTGYARMLIGKYVQSYQMRRAG